MTEQVEETPEPELPATLTIGKVPDHILEMLKDLPAQPPYPPQRVLVLDENDDA